MSKLNVAIDGPAGAGKSTVAKLLADKLGLLYIDTGSMYRALTWKALQLNYDFNDTAALAELSSEVMIKLITDNQNYRVFIDGEDVTGKIRQPEVSQRVSLVARIPEVRKNMVRQQQSMAASGGVVMDGRDIGTRVLPDAQAKFFLTASIEERARRRQRDLKQKGYHVPLETLMAEISQRDYIDQNRETDPLVPAEEAIIIDTTGLTINQVVEQMVQHIENVSDCK
ncbi:cytidylate kinase [Desulfohalotomaculum tongense]|uniref:(d)CMP kinase n=1 Tax=Desulforadius tongensis TaxID=1216062 RepID=UPI00195AC4F4|nr:(d)CMP kinase [Desulforadius tongensis]MBM7854643.1 cytidylate kinase [Desulforadius tongensis]